LNEHNDSQLATVRLTGEYDIARREELARLFQSIDGQRPLVIDMSDVSYVDSTFLNELANLRLSDKGRSITISGANEHIARLLKTVSFDQLFKILEER
jgi:anti-anti-sigma factor